MTDNPWLEIDRLMVGDIYTSNAAMENLAVLCDDCGSRFAGTPGERKAAEFLAAQLEAYGCTSVELESYRYTGWTRGPARLVMTEPQERALDPISLPYSPSGTIRAPLVSVGQGTPEEYARRDLAGKVVMAQSSSPQGYGRWIHRKEKYNRAVMAGAAAFVFVSEQPGLGPETGSLVDDGEGPIPGISIAYEEGAFIDRTTRRHGPVRVELETTDWFEERESWNVVGEIRGQEHPDEVILLGSHYDGHDIAQGATDPASGTIVVLEAARVLGRWAAEALPRSVRFVCFGTEEIGLTGSERYVEMHDSELDAIRFMLNLDAVGAMRGAKGLKLHHWPQLELKVEEWERQMCTDVPVGQRINAHSDHWAFFRAGIPSGWLGDPFSKPSGRGWGHTRFDTFDKVDVVHVRQAAANTARLALRLANAELPTRRSARRVDPLLDSDPGLEDYRIARALRASG